MALDNYGEFTIIPLVPIPPDDMEHPAAFAEASAIVGTGSWPHRKAIGELCNVFDTLFDGPGTPAYVGASRRVDDLFYEHPPLATVRVFSRWFWGDGVGVFAVIYGKGDRPVLMAVVAMAEENEAEAETRGLRNAFSRLGDL